MLTLALAATLLGFVLLILGLVTGTVWLAVACIVVCLVGLGFLLVDVFAGRKGDAGRSLEDMVAGAGRDAAGSDTGSSDSGYDDAPDSPSTHRSPADDGADAATLRYSVAGTAGPRDSEPVGDRPGNFEPGMAAPGGDGPSARPVPGRPAPERREGNLEDYLRSVGADAPAGDAPQRATGPEAPNAPGGQPGHPGGPTPPRYGSPPPGTLPQRRPPGSAQQSWTQQSGPQQQPGPQQSRSPQPGSRQPGPPQAWGQRPPAAASPGTRPSDPAQSGWVPDDVPRGDTAGGDDWATPSERPDADSPPRRRRGDFDPLDPNWHPPPE